MKILRTNADKGTAMISRRIDKIITRLECCHYSEVKLSEIETNVALTKILKWFSKRDPVQVLRDNGGI